MSNTCDDCHKPFSDCRCGAESVCVPHGSRRAEVDLLLVNACEGCDDGMEHAAALEDECRTLADEVDELRKAGRGFLDRCKAVSLECTKVCTENDAKDAVIGKLLEMLKPGAKPCSCITDDFKVNCRSSMPQYSCGEIDPYGWCKKAEVHARALEIAGRKE